MTPVVPFAIGLVAFAIGIALLRSFGPRYRVGRLLASVPTMTVTEAVAVAQAGGPARYVRILGRIDAETEFEDDLHRPLVFRRTRLDVRGPGGWRTVDDRREAVPFQLREGADGIGIHDADLDAGLVVLPRQSIGTAAEIPGRVPAGIDPGSAVRLLVEQVSSVEHAIAVGTPSLDAAGEPHLTAGLGRPLILTTLQTDEAMRVIAADHARRPLLAAISLAVGIGSLVVASLWALVETIT